MSDDDKIVEKNSTTNSYVNGRGEHLKFTNNSMSIYSDDPREPHSGVHINLDHDEGTFTVTTHNEDRTEKDSNTGNCFLTSACISATFGLSIQKTQAISFWNALIDSSKMAVGLYPKEKIGFDSIVSICPANRLETLITDWDASEEDLKLFDEQGIRVVVVDKPE